MKTLVLGAILSSALLAQAPFLGQSAAPTPDTVIAVIDGKAVTVSDFGKLLENAPAQIINLFKQNPQEGFKQVFVFGYLSAEGDKRKLGEKSPLKEELEAQRKFVIATAFVNDERDGYNVTQEMIEAAYKTNQSRYEQVKIKAIYVLFKPGAAPTTGSIEELAKAAVLGAHSGTDRPEPEAKALADDIVKQIKAGGKFEDLVQKYSEDPTTKAAGGDFGVVKSTSAYPDDLKKAILALKTGDVSAPIRQPNGYYIVRAEEKTLQPLTEVYEPIVQELRQNHLQQFLSQLNAKFAPEIKSNDFFIHPDDFIKAAQDAAKKK